MFSTIIKRDGRTAAYDVEKIAKAIFQAATSVGGRDFETAHALALQVQQRLEETYPSSQSLTVEQIQDMVEKVLIDTGHSRTAKEYILYRAQRTRVREMNTKLMKVYEDLTFKSAAENDIKRENANIDGNTAMGTMLKYGSEGAKAFYEMFVLDPEHARAHDCGDIHIHDLDFFSLTTTCCQIDLTKLFEGGFNCGYGCAMSRRTSTPSPLASPPSVVMERPARRPERAEVRLRHGSRCAQDLHPQLPPKPPEGLRAALRGGGRFAGAGLCKAHGEWRHPTLRAGQRRCAGRAQMLMQALGCEEKAAESAQRFAQKYSYEETERATYQAMEGLILDLNTMHSRAGAQTPFSSLNYGTDTSPEGRMVIRNMLLAEQAGLGHGETPIFPIHIFKVRRGSTGPATPTTTCSSWPAGSAPSGCSPTSPFWTRRLTCNTISPATPKPRSPTWAAAPGLPPTSTTLPGKSPPAAATSPTPRSTCRDWASSPTKTSTSSSSCSTSASIW